MKLQEIHNNYIRGTVEKAPVTVKTFLIARLPAVLLTHDCLGLKDPKVMISTIALKHIYDKRPAEEYDCVLMALVEVLEHPQHVYRNPSGKRGNLSITSTFKNKPYVVAIETLTNDIQVDGMLRKAGNYIATSFRQREEKYFKKYTQLWSWEDGTSSS